MKTLAIIPARVGSTRLPGKLLEDLEGKTVLQRTIEKCQSAGSVDEVVVATDDTRIKKHAERTGVKALITSSDHTSGTDRCAEALKQIGPSGQEVVLNLQGDEPFLDPGQIDLLVSLFQDEGTSIATLTTPLTEKEDANDPNKVKVVIDKQGYAMYFSRSPIPYEREPHSSPHDLHIGLYGFKASLLPVLTELPPTELERTESLEQLRWLYHGYSIRVGRTEGRTMGIDTPQDLEKAREYLRNSKG